MAKSINRAIRVGYDAVNFGGTVVKVIEYDSSGAVRRCEGVTVPTSGRFSKGAIFVKTDAADGTKGIYENQGTTSSVSFNLMGEITSTEVVLADGNSFKTAAGEEVLEFGDATDGVNQIKISNSATGANLVIEGKGDDTNVSVTLKGKGTGHLLLGQATATDVRLAADQPIADSSGNELVKFTKVASAVNEITIANAATGAFPTISATGEADTGIDFENSEGEEILKLDAIATAVNELTIKNAATGNFPIVAATGEADTGIRFENSESEEILILDSVASSVNEITIKSAATGNKPILAATGEADTGIQFENGESEEILILDAVATAVNELTISNAATSGTVMIEATGGDVSIPVQLRGKGTGAVYLGQATTQGVALVADQPLLDSANNELIKFVATATAVNEITVTNAATGNFPKISATGEADTGITFMNSEGEEILILDSIATSVNELTIKSAATGNSPIVAATGEADTGIKFENSEGEEILILDSIASSVNELTIRSAATGGKPIVAATGEADTGIEFHNGEAEEILILDAVATAVNEVTITNAATGVSPVISATGGDANISVTLTPKGTGEIVGKTAEAGAVGSVLRLQQKGGSQANSDVVGRFIFTGQDDAATPADEDYARIDVVVTDVTAANPDADMIFYTDVAGTLTERLRLTTASGAVVGADGVAASLSSKGASSLTVKTGSGTGAQIVLVDGTNGDVTATPNGTGKLTTTRGSSTIGWQTTPSAVTATADGLTTGVIAAGTGAVSVTSDDVNKIITLPTSVVGQQIMIYLGATGCELRTVALSNETINTVDSDGTNELALVAAGVFTCVCQAANKWVIYGWTSAGAAIATLTPDAA